MLMELLYTVSFQAKWEFGQFFSLKSDTVAGTLQFLLKPVNSVQVL